MSLLVDRLADMEGVIKELAQAQVANTEVLQQIGGRLPSPVPPSPDSQSCCFGAAPAGGLMGEVAGSFRSSPGVHRAPFDCLPLGDSFEALCFVSSAQ